MPSDADDHFVIGSKDINDISTWHWSLGSVPDKDDILDAGAALYPGDNIYFFGDRFAIRGNAQIGFWLFKNAVSTNPDGTFNGTHAIGDILLLANFVKGGGVPVVRAYEWVGSGGSDGTLNEISVSGTNLFALTNSEPAVSPWPYIPKMGPAGTFPIGAFFEGGINLNGINVEINTCFSSFLLETRASQSITAELKDFVFGNFFTQPQVTVNSETLFMVKWRHYSFNHRFTFCYHNLYCYRNSSKRMCSQSGKRNRYHNTFGCMCHRRAEFSTRYCNMQYGWKYDFNEHII
jgi:hypothetical protein